MSYLVVANHKYGDRVPIQIGTQVIDQLVATRTKRNYRRLGKAGGRYTWTPLSQKEILLEVPMLLHMILEGKKGKIFTMREVVIPPLVTTVVKGIVDLTTHSKYFIVVVVPVTGYSEHIAMARSYGELKPGKGKIDVCLRNHSARQVTLQKHTTMGDSSSVGPNCNRAQGG